MADLSSKKPKDSPSYIDMLKEAIVEWTAQHEGNSGEARKGISLAAVKSYITNTYNIDMTAKATLTRLKHATETAIESGDVVYAGTGNRYKLGVKEKKAKADAIAAARSSDNEESESEESEAEPSPPPKGKRASAKKVAPAKKAAPKKAAPKKKVAAKAKPAVKKASAKAKAPTKGAAKKKAK